MRRSGGVLLAACLALGGPVTTAHAAATGPVVVDTHTRHAAPHAVHLSADGDVTAYTDSGGRSYLVRGPLTITEPIVLRDGAPTSTDPYWVAARDEVRAGIVALPVLDGGTVVEVAWCAVHDCPTTATLDVPDGHRYVGHGGDVALVYDPTGHDLHLLPWDGTAGTAVDLGAAKPPYVAQADATGIALSNPKEVSYVARATGAVTVLGAGNSARLTPSYVAWLDAEETTKAYRATRADLAAPPVVVLATGYTTGPHAFAATEAGISYSGIGSRLTTKTWTGAPVTWGHLGSHTVAPAGSGTAFLVNYRFGTQPGLYLVSPGSTGKTFQHALPPEPAAPSSMAVAAGRVAYVDDSGLRGPLYTRPVDGATPGPETAISAWADEVAISGATTVFTRGANADGTVDLVYGRPGVTYRQIEDLYVGSDSELSVSGNRAVLSGPSRSWLIDTTTGRARSLGNVRATIFGDYLVTMSSLGRVLRQHLSTGAVHSVHRPAVACDPCSVHSVSLAAWGEEVVYAYRYGTVPVAAHWDGATGVTTPLALAEDTFGPMSYWDGLLAVPAHRSDATLYDLRAGLTGATIPGSRLLGGNAVDGRHVAYRATGLRNRAVVQPVTDFFPGYQPSAAYYLGVSSPKGFGPGLPIPVWKPAFAVSEDVTWTLELRRGPATGPVVKTFSGTSAHGAITPVWDGRTAAGAAAPHGWYTWVLTGTGPGGTPLAAPGTPDAPIRGQVFLSRTTPAAPKVSAPRLASDVGTNGHFTVKWSGAVADTMYRVQRARDGLRPAAWATVRTTTARSMLVEGLRGTGYRFRVALVDPAGRVSPNGTAETIVPHGDTHPAQRYSAGNGPWVRETGAAFWGGARRTTTYGGNDYSFGAYGDTLWLIGSKGPGYGRIAVSVDGGPEVVVDTYAATTRHRQVLFRVSGLALDRYHSLRAIVVGTPGRPTVSIDGAAARHRRG